MLLPKCVTCKTDLSDKELIFEEKKNAILNSNISEEEIQKKISVLLTDLEINNLCCKMRMLTYVDAVHVIK